MTHPNAVPMDAYDVVVIGGGPAGATVATLLARAGLRVAIFERERFPRFRIGESLLPTNVPIFDRLGCHEAIRQAGFLRKPGVTFCDEFEGRGCSSTAFTETRWHPAFSYNVVRADFDTLLLRHAVSTGATVYEQHTVEETYFAPDKVTVRVRGPKGDQQGIQAALVVDASGRAAFLGGRLGRREALPELGKVALFAHFRGAQREPGIPEGNIRLYLVPSGWMWRIPFANGMDSVGCVLHARVAKERPGSITELFEATIASAPRLLQGLVGAQRVTPVHTAANFSYRVSPAVGERYIAIGDALGFVDPIFSTGVFFAMRSAELAAEVILPAFAQQDFRAQRFQPYEKRMRRGLAPFLRFIQRFYDPALLDLLCMARRPRLLSRCVMWVLSGAAFEARPLWVRAGLLCFFGIAAGCKIARWVVGQPVQSRWHW